MPRYTIKDSQTGKTVTFDWNGPEPPTDADMSEVFASAGVDDKPDTAQERTVPPGKGMLPTAGSFIGSAVGTAAGPVGRIAGAGIGGALGKGAELFFDDKDDSIGDSLAAMGTEGATQAGFEAAGGMVGKALRGLAPKLADLALNPIESVARKYPNLGKTYVQEGKLFAGLRGGVGAVGKKESTEQARGLMSASKKASDDAITAADTAGAGPVVGRQVIQELRPLMREARIAAKAGKADVRPQIRERAKSFADQNVAITNAEANTLRRSLDTSSDQAHVAASRMGQPTSLESRVDKALAGGLRKKMRANVNEVRPKDQPIEGMTGRTRDLAGLTKALDKASTRKHLLTRNVQIASGLTGLGSGVASGDPGAGVGAGAAVGTLAYLLTNPRHLGRMALASHGAGSVAEWTPEAIRAAMLLSGLLEQEPQQGTR